LEVIQGFLFNIQQLLGVKLSRWLSKLGLMTLVMLHSVNILL